MTTARRLWLGFGTLTALLVLSSVAIFVRVRSIERQVGDTANIALTRSVAARQLEINVLGYSLAVRAQHQSDDPKIRQDAVKEASDVEQHLQEYQGLATTGRQREMAARFVPLWQELQKLGQALLEAETRQLTPEDSKRFYDLRAGLERLLDDEMQVEAVDAYNASRDASVADLRNIAGLSLILSIVGAVIAVVTSGAVGARVVKSERQLWASRERLRVTLASIGDAVITTDADGRITYLNAVAESLTGWKQSEAAGRPLDTVFHIVNESTRQTVENPAARAFREGVVVGLANHTVLIANDGTERPIDDSAAPIQDEHGNVAGCVLIFRDVSHQRQARRALEQSEARKTAMFETALDCIISIDHEGAIIEFNAAAERTFGHGREDVLGRELASTIIPPADRARHRQGLARYLATGEGPVLNQRLELSALRADGAEFPVELTVTRIPVDGPPLFTAYLRDITARKRAEDALLASERRLHFVMDSAPQKIFTAKPSGDVDYFNPQWTEFTGLSFEQIRDWGWPQFIHPDDVSENVRVWQHSIDTGAPFEFEHRFRRSDGAYRWHLSRAVPLRNAEGQVLMWVGSNTDVHEQKQTAIELRELAARLSEADRRKNEFLAMLAHELRNPLAPIRNALQVMRLSGGDGQTVQSASEMMERQVGQMVRLVDDLLDVSRISRGKIELRKGRIELASAVNHAVEAIRPLCESMDHDLTVTLPPHPVYLNADPTRLAQVVGNLLNNACKFSDKGGRIWLTVEQEFPQPPYSTGGLEGVAVLRVRDNGIGIGADQLPRIFDMFTQVDTSLERSQSGLGIGLTLVKNVVEMHNGTVAVHSAGVGQGTEFVVRLPIDPPFPPLASGGQRGSPPPEPMVSAPPTTTTRRILVVDDNRDSATTLSKLLALTGNETRTAYDGLEAVEAAAAFRPDVILLDIGLPKLNGYEAARKIRAQPGGQGIVLVALTGWGQDEDRSKSEEAGFDGHMVKPVDYDALMKLLAEPPTRPPTPLSSSASAKGNLL